MAKYKIENIADQAALDRLIKDIREESSNNYSDASARTQRKIEQLEAQIERQAKEMNEMEAEFQEVMQEVQAEMQEYDQALTEAYQANDTYELTEMLNEAGIESRFHDLAIKSAGLSSDMDEEEFGEAINNMLESYPEFGLASDSPLNGNQEQTNPVGVDSESTEVFDTNKTMQ